jgi:drug/metabolite transporter (DMT)-like permease
MSWLLFMVLSIFLFSLGNVFEKILISKFINLKNMFGYLNVLFLTHIINFLVFISFATLSLINIKVYLLMIIRTGLLVCGIYVSTRLMIKEEVSRLIGFLFTNIIVAFILDFLIFNTKLSIYAYFGAALLLCNGFLMAYKPSKKMFIHREDLFYLSINVMIWGVYAVLIKTITGYIDSFTFLTIDAFNMVLVGLIWYIFHKEIRVSAAKIFVLGKKFWLTFALMMFAYMPALYLYFKAFSLQKVSVLVPFETLQPTFVLIIALFLSRYFPKILKEETDLKTISYKVVALLFLTVGMYMMITYGTQ